MSRNLFRYDAKFVIMLAVARFLDKIATGLSSKRVPAVSTSKGVTTTLSLLQIMVCNNDISDDLINVLANIEGAFICSKYTIAVCCHKACCDDFCL